MSIRYDQNTKARAVRLVRQHRDDYDSEWATMKAVSGRPKITLVILKPQHVSSRGSATRYIADCQFIDEHNGTYRGRTDLPGVGRARRADRPAHLRGAPIGGAVETGPVGHHDHRNHGLLRT